MIIHDLIHYPVKSFKGVHVPEINTTPKGFVNDRRYMLIKDKDTFVTARTHPILARTKVEIKDENMLQFTFPQKDTVISITPRILNEKRSIAIWGDQSPATLLMPNALTSFLSDLFKENISMVYMQEEDIRPIDPKYSFEGEAVSFADGFPILITTTASLNDLNLRLKSPVPMDRFRPNLVIDHDMPWEEDEWRRLQIGNIQLRVVKPCARCVVTTLDLKTGIFGDEPLKTLSTFRAVNGKIMFGMNAIIETQGTLKKGQQVVRLE